MVHSQVGTFAGNGLGLHEVHGNVWEWCLDGFHPGFYGRSPESDPVALWEGAATHVARGGSFSRAAANARSAIRLIMPPSRADNDVGVRPARVITE